MKIFKIIVLAFFLVMFTVTGVNAVATDKSPLNQVQANNDGATKLLKKFFDNAKRIKSDFKQVSFDAGGKVTQEVEGVLTMSRPNRFRWDYQKPYEQMILADGVKLWVYDKDLDQVTVREQANAISSTPASILTEGFGAVEKEFDTSFAGESQGLKWVLFTPKNSNSEYGSIRLGFLDEILKVVQIADKFDQLTYLEFENLQLNIDLDESVFSFTPPEDVDVIGIEK